MSREFNIVVVGAGLTGLTIAALLAQSDAARQMRLTLIDAGERVQHPGDGEVSLRVSAIATGSAALLDDMGAWQAVAARRVCPYTGMRVWDESSTAESGDALRFDAAEFAVAELGFIVENSLLQDRLLALLDDLRVELVFAASIEQLQAKGTAQEILLADGRRFPVDLVIGADGARSFVRESAGIETRERAYEQTAFVTHLQPERPHRHTAWQRFLKTGPLGMLPLSDGRVSIVWSTSVEQAEWAMTATDDELSAAVSQASDYVLGNLQVAGPRGTFPLIARHAEHYVKAGVALVGDAAHAVHPLAGQGANLGMQDAAALAEVLRQALGQGEHPGDRPVLRRYERRRKGANSTMLHFMTGLNRLFATDSALLQELRTTGMRLFNRSGPLRERVVGVALGAKR